MKKQYQYIGAEYTMIKVEADDQEKTKVVNGEIVESSREDEKYFTRNGFVLLGEVDSELEAKKAELEKLEAEKLAEEEKAKAEAEAKEKEELEAKKAQEEAENISKKSK
jgi:hypothetical protein